MTTDILLREDTGTHAVVRVIDPGVHVSAPYSRAVGHLDRWVRDERRAVDEFAAWIEGRTAQAAAEMRQLCDELELPFKWAQVWDDEPGDPASLQLPNVELTAAVNAGLRHLGHPVQPSSLNPAEPDPVFAYMDADDSDERPGRRVRLTPRDNPLAQAYAEREARGWTPDPANYGALLETRVPGPVIRRELPGLTSGQHRNETGDATPTASPSVSPPDHGPIDRWLARADTRLRQTRWARWLGERFTPVKEEQ